MTNILQDNAGYSVAFHPSIPEGSVKGWSTFPPPHKVDTILMHGGPSASQHRQSTATAANPIVSHYNTAEQEAHREQETGLLQVPPSRSWSPIPSIHRRSSRTGQEGSTKNLTLASEPQAQSTPFQRSIVSEHSTSGGKSNRQKRRLIEYPVIPVEKERVTSVCIVTTSTYNYTHENRVRYIHL